MAEEQNKLQHEYENEGLDFYIEPVYGIRVWHMDMHSGDLIGQWWGRWHPDENVSRCENEARTHDPSQTLVEDCTCGYYAYWYLDSAHSMKDFLLYAAAAKSIFTGGCATVFGVVKGYGRVMIGTKGFRAEKCAIAALATAREPDPEPELDFVSLLNQILNKTTASYQDPWLRMNKRPRADYTEHIPLFHSIEDMLKEFPCKKP